jgi:hypothetical protein
MVENESEYHFPRAESEFTSLGITHIKVEGVDETPTTLALEAFCQSLPTAGRLARSFGSWRVARLIARQLEYKFIDPYYHRSPRNRLERISKRIAQFTCLITALNYVSGEDESPYYQPLPYSVALVLVSQLAYRVREKLSFPPEVTKRIRNAPKGVEVFTPSTRTRIDARAFTSLDEKSIYRDSSIPAEQTKRILESGVATLIGTNLMYMPETPWSSNFILRSTAVGTETKEIDYRFSIPGGHTMNTEGLAVALRSAKFLTDMNLGRDKRGHLLLDVPFTREALEETGLPLFTFATTRPLVRADQVMRNIDGKPTRYLAYVGQTLIWPDTERLLTRDIIKAFNVTPITEIALRVYRE